MINPVDSQSMLFNQGDKDFLRADLLIHCISHESQVLIFLNHLPHKSPGK